MFGWGAVYFLSGILCLMYYVYYMPIQFVETKTKTCISSIHGRGLCSSLPMNKGTALGLLWSIDNNVHRFSPQGKYINHATVGNIKLIEVVWEGRRDIYGYLTRSVVDGEELVVNYDDPLYPGKVPKRSLR
jgi:hypothetical protein